MDEAAAWRVVKLAEWKAAEVAGEVWARYVRDCEALLGYPWSYIREHDGPHISVPAPEERQ